MKPLFLTISVALLFVLTGCDDLVSPNGIDTTDGEDEDLIWIEHSQAFLFTQYHYEPVVDGAYEDQTAVRDWVESNYWDGGPLSTVAPTYVPDPEEDNEGINTAPLEDFLADYADDYNWTRIMIFAVATSDDDPIFDHIDPILADYPDLSYIVIWVPGIGTDGFVEDAKEAIQSATF